MSKLSEKLRAALEAKLNYPCKIWFSRKYPYGWMFETDLTYMQRIGYTYKQAIDFINRYDWSWLKNHITTQCTRPSGAGPSGG